MSFSINERVIASFNALVGGVLDSDPVAQWYESINPFEFVSEKNKVWTQSDVLRDNPAANLATAQANVAGPLSGIVDDLSDFTSAVRLTSLPSVNNGWVALSTYGDFSSDRLDNWVQPSFVPQTNGLPSTGYAVRVFNGDPSLGGVEVLTTDGTTGTGQSKSVGWVFNYAGGLLLVADDYNGITDPWITGFRYIGTVAGSGSGGGGNDCEKRFVVCDPLYGAVGDGVTDDGPAIRALIATVKAAGGGTIYFPPGNYRVRKGTGLSASAGLGVFNLKDCQGIHFRGEWGTSRLVMDGITDVELGSGPGTTRNAARMFDVLGLSGNLSWQDLVLDMDQRKGGYSFRGTELLLQRTGQTGSLSAPDVNGYQTLTASTSLFRSERVLGQYVVVTNSGTTNNGSWPVAAYISDTSILIYNPGGAVEAAPSFDYELWGQEQLSNHWSEIDPNDSFLADTINHVLTVQGSRVGAQTFPADVGRIVPDDTRTHEFSQILRMQNYVNASLRLFDTPSPPLNGAIGVAILSDDEIEYAALEYDGVNYRVFGNDANGLFASDNTTYADGTEEFLNVKWDPDQAEVTFSGLSTGAGTLVVETGVDFTEAKTFRAVLYYRSKDSNATPDTIDVSNFAWRDTPYDPKSDDNHAIEIRGIGGTNDYQGVDLIAVHNVRFQHTDGDGVRTLGVNAHSQLRKLVITECEFLDLGRSGVSFQHDVEEVIIADCVFEEGTDQQVDQEPTSQNAPSKFIIENNIFDGRMRNGYLVTLAGVTTSARPGGAAAGVFANNHLINGSVFGLDIDRLDVRGNHFYGEYGSITAMVSFDGFAERLKVEDNHFYQRDPGRVQSCFTMQTRNEYQPAKLSLSRNEFYQQGQANVVSIGDVNDSKITDNLFEYTGPNANIDFIRFNQDTGTRDVENNIIDQNTFIGDLDHCVRIVGGTGGGYTSVSHNHGRGMANVLEIVGANWSTPPVLIGNNIDFSGSLVTGIAAWIIGGNIGDVRVLAGTGDPNTVVPGSVGDVFHRKDGTSGNIFYICEGGTVWSLTGGSATNPVIDTTQRTADFTVLANTIYLLNPSGGAFTVTLPAVSSFNNGDIVGFKYNVASAQGVTLDADGSDVIDGQTTFFMNQPYGAILLKPDGVSNWWIV